MRLKISFLYNKVFYIAFGILLGLCSLINIWFVPIFVIYIIWLKKTPVYYLTLLLIFVTALLFIRNHSIDRDICTVVESNGTRCICKSNVGIVLYGEYELGDILSLDGEYVSFDEASSPFTFSKVKYWNSKNIEYQFYGTAEIIDSKFVLGMIPKYVEEYFDSFDQRAASYLKALILGDKRSLDDDYLDNIKSMGIIHLFAISGLHVGLFVLIVRRVLEYFVKDTDYYIIILLLLYCIIAGFAVSILRAASMFILNIVFRKLRYQFTSLDVISLVFIGFVLYNPKSLFDIGFQLSFTVSLFLILSSRIIKGSQIRQLAMTSLVAQLATLPIIININNEVNLSTIIFNIIFVYLMTIFLPITFIVVTKFLVRFYIVVIDLFEHLVIFLSNYSFIIEIPNMHISMVILYYYLLYVFFTKLEKDLIDFKTASLIIITVLTTYISPFEKVVIIDVEHGDCILYTTSYNQESVLIDTGGVFGKQVTENNVVPVLKSLGVRKLDYLVLTHGHFDHAGGYRAIIRNFEVKNIVVSYYSESSLIDDVINYANYKNINITRLREGDSFSNFTVLSPSKIESSINNQSLVLEARLLNKDWIFYGDSELMYIPGKEYDYLKVGHHGSITSTNQDLADSINPDVSFISLGNREGFPDNRVVYYLRRTEIYYTNIHNTIFCIDGFDCISTNDYDRYILGRNKTYNN